MEHGSAVCPVFADFQCASGTLIRISVVDSVFLTTNNYKQLREGCETGLLLATTDFVLLTRASVLHFLKVIVSVDICGHLNHESNA